MVGSRPPHTSSGGLAILDLLTRQTPLPSCCHFGEPLVRTFHYTSAGDTWRATALLLDPCCSTCRLRADPQSAHLASRLRGPCTVDRRRHSRAWVSDSRARRFRVGTRRPALFRSGLVL